MSDGSFLAADYLHVADLLERAVESDSRSRVAGIMSNNLNIILNALRTVAETEYLRAELEDLRADCTNLHIEYDKLMQERLP